MSKNSLKLTLSVLPFIFSTAYAATCTIPAYTAHFNVYHDGSQVAKTVESLKIPQRGYYQFGYHFATDIMFYQDKSYEISSGRYTPSLILPETYAYHDDHSGEQTHIQFNYKTKKINITNSNGGKKTIALSPLVKDHIVYELMLRKAIIQHLFPKTYRIIDTHGVVRNYKISWTKQWIQTPIGSFHTMEATVTTQFKGKTLGERMWFAKADDYAMIQDDTLVNGKVYARSVPQAYTANTKWGCI